MNLERGDIILVNSDYITPDGVTINNHYFLIVETDFDYIPLVKGIQFDIEALAFTSLKNSKGTEKITRLLQDRNNIPVYQEDYVNGNLYDSVVKCDCIYLLNEVEVDYVYIDSLKKDKLTEIQNLLDSNYDNDELDLNAKNVNGKYY